MINDDLSVQVVFQGRVQRTYHISNTGKRNWRHKVRSEKAGGDLRIYTQKTIHLIQPNYFGQ